MKYAYIAVIICLLIAFLWAISKYILFKKQIKHFVKAADALKETDYNEPIKVESFDGCVTALANSLNEHIDIQKKLSEEYTEEKKNLATIISGISHDFRTPLTATLGYLQMIEKSNTLDDKNAEYLNIAIEKNRYIKKLSDDFFEISTQGNTEEDTQLEEVNISNIVFETLSGYYDGFSQRKLVVKADIEDGVFINSNAHLLQRIIDNLLSNANKYALTTLCINLAKENQKVILSVSNDTLDKAELDIDRVFEPFYRKSSRNQNGSGLGLYIVKRSAKLMGAEADAFFDKRDFFTVKLEFEKPAN